MSPKCIDIFFHPNLTSTGCSFCTVSRTLPGPKRVGVNTNKDCCGGRNECSELNLIKNLKNKIDEDGPLSVQMVTTFLALWSVEPRKNTA